MKIIFLGPPGAGKGTQSAIISKKYKIPTISTGDIIRNEIRAHSELGVAAETFIKKGELVPDDVVIGIIRERLTKDDCKNGFILDGFPRTVTQAEALIHMNVPIDLVLDLQICDEAIIERMSGRLYCSHCGATYHRLYHPPLHSMLCDQCHNALSVRDDDQPQVVRDRLRVYHNQTKPLEKFYSDIGKLFIIHADKKIDEITDEIMCVLDKVEFGK